MQWLFSSPTGREHPNCLRNIERRRGYSNSPSGMTSMNGLFTLPTMATTSISQPPPADGEWNASLREECLIDFAGQKNHRGWSGPVWGPQHSATTIAGGPFLSVETAFPNYLSSIHTLRSRWPAKTTRLGTLNFIPKTPTLFDTAVLTITVSG